MVRPPRPQLRVAHTRCPRSINESLNYKGYKRSRGVLIMITRQPRYGNWASGFRLKAFATDLYRPLPKPEAGSLNPEA
jgi:hypothetical protein